MPRKAVAFLILVAACADPGAPAGDRLAVGHLALEEVCLPFGCWKTWVSFDLIGSGAEGTPQPPRARVSVIRGTTSMISSSGQGPDLELVLGGAPGFRLLWTDLYEWAGPQAIRICPESDPHPIPQPTVLCQMVTCSLRPRAQGASLMPCAVTEQPGPPAERTPAPVPIRTTKLR